MMGLMVKRPNMPIPSLSEGPGGVEDVPGVVSSAGAAKPLMVTDRGITSIDLGDGLPDELRRSSNGSWTPTTHDAPRLWLAKKISVGFHAQVYRAQGRLN